MGWEGASVSIPRGGGCCKSVVLSVILPWRVSALVMSNLMFEAHWPMKALPSRTCSAGGGGESQGGDVALNSLPRTQASSIM